MIYIRNTPENLKRQLSEHFIAGEFRCKCNNCGLTLIHEYGLHLLTVLRRLYGYEIIFTSGYRCQEHNRNTPNATHYSDHPKGMAWDILLPKENDKKQMLIAFCKVIFPHYYVTSVFIHVSIRGFETRTY